jgi:SAM-dependent methyltransferase
VKNDPGNAYVEDTLSPRVRFDEVETTISHLFRRPHPALQGRTYGQALYDALVKRGLLDASKPVVELGAGSGFVAEAFCLAAQAQGQALRYGFVEVSRPLLRAQRQRVPRAFGIRASAEALPFATGALTGLFLVNEVIADLRVDAGDSEEGRACMRAHGLPDDPAVPVAAGTARLLSELWRCQAPGATTCLTEFGEEAPARPVRLSGPGGAGAHTEMTVDLRQLLALARGIGFEVECLPLATLLDIDLTQRVASHLDVLKLRRFVRDLPILAFPKAELEARHPLLTRFFLLEFPRIGSPRFPTPRAVNGFSQLFFAMLLRKPTEAT